MSEGEYPRKVEFTEIRWECGFTKPNGQACRHMTAKRALECADNRRAHEAFVAERERLLASIEATQALAKAQRIVADLIDGQSVAAVAATHGITTSRVRSVFHYCIFRAVTHRATVAESSEEIRALRFFRYRSATLTLAREKRGMVETALAGWWPTASLPQDLWS